MRRGFLKFYFFNIVILSISLSLVAQKVVQDLVSPEKKRILFYEEEQTLVFIIKTKPDTVINIEITNDNSLFVDVDKQTEENFISDFLIVGKTSEIASDEKLEKKWKLPLESLKTLIQGKKQRHEIYYRALVLGPEDEEGESDITHWSLSDDDSKNAPYVEVYKSHEAYLSYEQYLKGVEFFNQGEYEKAIKEYESAWFYSPNPAYIHNIAVCHLKLAIENFEEYSEDPDTEEENRKIIRKLIQLLRAAPEEARK